MRIADVDHPPAHGGTNAVGDDAVGGKVTSPDHVARTRRRKPHAAVREKTLPIAVCRDLRTALARRIRIIAQERLILAVAPRPLLVFVDLVRRHKKRGAHRIRRANAFEDVDCPHHIHRKRLHGLTVACAHNWLCREVKDNLRARRSERTPESVCITHIPAQIAKLL